MGLRSKKRFFLTGIFILALLGLSNIYPFKPPQPNVLSAINEYGRDKVKYPVDFLIVLVGDSMTQYFGNSDELREYLKRSYPNKTFDILNYGFGSTSVLTLPQRLESESYYDRIFRPILDIDFDLILIESFGHNPLSQYPLDVGLKKQTEALDKALELINRYNPDSKVAFVATIAPNKKVYAYRQVDLDDVSRENWANERIAYIKNHIKYANDHNIPVINIFEKSLDSSGDSNLEYISDSDYIHPSPKGVIFMSEEVAKFIRQNKLLQ